MSAPGDGRGAKAARWRGRALAALVLGFSMLSLVRAAVLQETDPYWQVRAGLENLAGASLTRADTWSWAPVDHPFRQTSPAWNDVLAIGWTGLGWLGLTIVGAASIGGYLLMCALLGRRLGARPLPMLIGSAPLLLLALPALSPRASLTAVTLTLLVVLVAPRWGRVVGRTQWAPIFLVTGGALVSLVGIWIHLSWLLLGPLSGLSWVLAAAAAPASRSRRFASAAAAEVGFVAGALAGPYGPGAIGYSRDVADSSTGLLLEWISPFASGTAPRWALPAIAALAATAYGTVQLVRHRRDRGDHALTSAGLLAVAVACGPGRCHGDPLRRAGSPRPGPFGRFVGYQLGRPDRAAGVGATPEGRDALGPGAVLGGRIALAERGDRCPRPAAPAGAPRIDPALPPDQCGPTGGRIATRLSVVLRPRHGQRRSPRAPGCEGVDRRSRGLLGPGAQHPWHSSHYAIRAPQPRSSRERTACSCQRTSGPRRYGRLTRTASGAGSTLPTTSACGYVSPPGPERPAPRLGRAPASQHGAFQELEAHDHDRHQRADGDGRAQKGTRCG